MASSSFVAMAVSCLILLSAQDTVGQSACMGVNKDGQQINLEALKMAK